MPDVLATIGVTAQCFFQIFMDITQHNMLLVLEKLVIKMETFIFKYFTEISLSFFPVYN